jgi:murein DD-endopeptidase MepM/ murein hydrolase activator NlpD
MSNIKLKKDSTSLPQSRNAVLSKISLFYKGQILKASIVLVTIFTLTIAPLTAQAGFFSFIGDLFGTGVEASEIETIEHSPANTQNSQTLTLLEPSLTTDLKNTTNNSTVTVVGDEAIEPKVGPLGTEADMAKSGYSSSSEKIKVYVVKAGDTLDGIAKSFNVTKQAIIYANSDINKDSLTKVGTSLVIIPLNGALYTVKSTDTAEIISKKYKISVADILEYNVLEKAGDLKSGAVIVLVGVDKSALVEKPVVVKKPDPVPEPVVVKPTTPVISAPVEQGPAGQPKGTIAGNYIWPLPAGIGRVSQGLHGDQAYDFAAPKGTPIFAPQNGTVLIVHPTGYNGGYGRYVVINFNDGRQAIFGHMTTTAATAGQEVKQGDIIGFVGSTGKSTGPHVHIGFRGPLGNPYAGLPKNSTELSHD